MFRDWFSGSFGPGLAEEDCRKRRTWRGHSMTQVADRRSKFCVGPIEWEVLPLHGVVARFVAH